MSSVFIQCPKCGGYMVSKFLSETLYWYCPICGYVPTYTTNTSTHTTITTDKDTVKFTTHMNYLQVKANEISDDIFKY